MTTPSRDTSRMGRENTRRADRAAEALRLTGYLEGGPNDIGIRMDAAIDLMADMHHWCERHHIDTADAFRYARQHYLTEIGEQ